ncbi:hypothetical protein JTS93_16690 [Clostridium botulinum]|nr:hypothetical protein [Clostridium botulinum]
MSQLKAITNSSTEDMKKMSDQAKDLGVKPGIVLKRQQIVWSC